MASKQVECPKCGTHNDAADTKCSTCGIGLQWVLKYWGEYVSGPQKTHSPLILISDPSAFEELYRRFFERMGVAYRLAEAQGGDAFQTIELAKRLQPDLIIMELLRSGNVPGDEMIRELRAAPHTGHIPILLASTIGPDHPGFAAALDAGATWYLPKPLEAHELTATVASILADGPAVWIIHPEVSREACRAMEDRQWRVWTHDLPGALSDPVRMARLLMPDVIAIAVSVVHDILPQLQASPDVCDIPVVILAEGTDSVHQEQAQAMGVESIYVGSINSDGLLEAIYPALHKIGRV